MKLRNNVITVVDVGTSKIICLIAVIDSNDNLKIIGSGHHISQGFKAGTVTNIKLAENSIFKSVEAAEKMANISIDKALVSINSSKIESCYAESTIGLNGNPISNKDINKLTNQILEQFNNPNYELVSHFPLGYSINNEQNIIDPRLMFGNHLGCKLHVITSPSNILLNLVNCFARCHIDIEEFVVSPYASSLSCLNSDEISSGSILIDIGGATTSIAVFNGGTLISCGAVLIGGIHITSDISYGLSLNYNDAERVKILHGSCINNQNYDYEVIDLHLQNENEISYVKTKELIEIIIPRVEELFEMVKIYIKEASINQTISRKIVITGGSSQLPGIKEKAAEILKTNIRIANPADINGLSLNQTSPIFSTSIGMTIYGYNKFLAEKYKVKENESRHFNYLKKILDFF